jgi:hypothetical protein
MNKELNVIFLDTQRLALVGVFIHQRSAGQYTQHPPSFLTSKS